MVDDKLRVLAAMKEILQERLATVFPRQGRYAFDPVNIAQYPAADFTVEHIGDLADFDVAKLLEMPINAARTQGTPGRQALSISAWRRQRQANAIQEK